MARWYEHKLPPPVIDATCAGLMWWLAQLLPALQLWPRGAWPFGLGAAVFISEFCSRRVKETLKIVIELLAAIPSVVWGFIGLTVMNPLIMDLFGQLNRVGVTLLVATHDWELVRRMHYRTLSLRHGKLAEDSGPPRV